MKHITMSNIVAKPHGVFFFLFFLKFKLFFLFLQERERPVGGEWNFPIDIVKICLTLMENIVSTKNKKEEKTYNFNLYLNLS